MKRRNGLLILVVGAVLVGAVAAFGGTVGLGSVGKATPSELPPQELTEPALGFQGNIRLEAPPQDYAPKVSADAASEAALKQAEAKDAKTIQATLASFSWSAVPVDENGKPTGPPLYTDVPVWVITVDGVCSALAPETGECVNTEMNFVVDARSGKVIVGYGNEEDLIGHPL
jgi:hypothetical protein